MGAARQRRMVMQRVSELVTPEPYTCVSPVQSLCLDSVLESDSDPQAWLRGGGAPPSPEPRKQQRVVFSLTKCLGDLTSRSTMGAGGGRSKHAQSVAESVSQKKHSVTRAEHQDYEESVDSGKQMSEIERFEKKMQQKEIARFSAHLQDPNMFSD